MQHKNFLLLVLIVVAISSVMGRWGETKPSLYSPEVGDIPLKSIEVSGDIVDFIGRVELTQHYHNSYDRAINCIYKFPLDEKAVVVELTAEIDGKIIQGIAKEKNAAKKEYEQAVRHGQKAYLMELESNDVVSLKIGNLAAGNDVKITVVYLTELGLDGDQLRFVLPTTIAPKYGSANPTLHNVGTNPPTRDQPIYPLHLSLQFTMPSKILAVTSPSHPFVFDPNLEYPNKNTVSVKLDWLDSDVVFLIETEQPHVPRLWIESGADADTLMFAMYPDFANDDAQHNHHQTVTFIVDKSGSMGGEKMQIAQKATLNAIDLLHSRYPNARVNIVSFSSAYEKLFSAPVALDTKAKVAEALKFVKALRADGGTELLAPLLDVLRGLDDSADNNVIVLTDGEVGYTDSLLSQAANTRGSTRIFTIGIGYAASQALVNGLAKTGEGAAEYAVPGEEGLRQKVLRQLERALVPTRTIQDVTWGSDTVFYQSPSKYPVPVYQKSRVLGFATIQKGSLTEPVSIHFQNGEVMELRAQQISGNVLAKLSAKYRIRDLEALPQGSDEVKESIVALATKHNLLSKHTSFIAVDRSSAMIPAKEEIQVPLQTVREESGYYGGNKREMITIAGGIAYRAAQAVQQVADAVASSVPASGQFYSKLDESAAHETLSGSAGDEDIVLLDIEPNYQGSNWLTRLMSSSNHAVPLFSLILLCVVLPWLMSFL